MAEGMLEKKYITLVSKSIANVLVETNIKEAAAEAKRAINQAPKKVFFQVFFFEIEDRSQLI